MIIIVIYGQIVEGNGHNTIQLMVYIFLVVIVIDFEKSNMRNRIRKRNALIETFQLLLVRERRR